MEEVSSWTPAACEAHHVGRGGDALGGPQGLLPEQSSTSEVRVSNAVACWRRTLGWSSGPSVPAGSSS